MKKYYLALILSLFAPAAMAQGLCSNAATWLGRVVSGTTYTVQTFDYCKVVVLTNGSSVSVTLPAIGTAGGINLDFSTRVFMEGAGSATVTPTAPFGTSTAPTINGASSLSISTGTKKYIFIGNDGNWYASP